MGIAATTGLSFSSSNAIVSVKSSCMDASTLTNTCVGRVVFNKWAMAGGEFRGDMGKAGMPPRNIPTNVVKKVMVSKIRVRSLLSCVIAQGHTTSRQDRDHRPRIDVCTVVEIGYSGDVPARTMSSWDELRVADMSESGITWTRVDENRVVRIMLVVEVIGFGNAQRTIKRRNSPTLILVQVWIGRCDEKRHDQGTC